MIITPSNVQPDPRYTGLGTNVVADHMNAQMSREQVGHAFNDVFVTGAAIGAATGAAQAYVQAQQNVQPVSYLHYPDGSVHPVYEPVTPQVVGGGLRGAIIGLIVTGVVFVGLLFVYGIAGMLMSYNG